MSRQAAWLAIVNPASGRSRARTSWPRVLQALTRAGVDVEVAQTSRAQEGEEIARSAVGLGRRFVLAAGGDGSVNDVVNGIMQAGVAPEDPVTLVPIPLGTGNDWARSLGIARDPVKIAAAVAGGSAMLHDVGVIDFPAAAPGAARRRWFINVAGAGYDAHVIARLPRPVPSALAYLRGALAGLATYRSPAFRITVGTATIDQRLLLVFVANGRYCGNRMLVAPHARLDDGLLEVVAIEEVGLGAVLWRLAKLYRGTLLGDAVVRHLQGARVRIEAQPAVAVEADGQIVGYTPAEISVRPRAMRVLCGAQ